MKNEFAKAVLVWYDANRRSLPWRETSEPYKIWISEIMLQQTRAETVAKRYHGFLERFPDVFALADAPEDVVLKAWEGLGYYARARNLHRAAKIVAYEMGGRMPGSSEELRKLPGIGAYAACSIASIAYREAVPALDANLARVFARVSGRRAPLSSPADLYPCGAEYIDAERPGDFNQALMDIGAGICLPNAPKCEECPVYGFCAGGMSGTPEDFPEKTPKPVRREEQWTVLLVLCRGRILIRRRPSKGLLGGLWDFPTAEGHPGRDALTEDMKRQGFANAGLIRELPCASHTFTHLVWRMRGWLAECDGFPESFTAVDAEGLEQAAMPSALRTYRECAADILNG